MKLGFLAAAALGLAASGQVFGREPEYTIPNGWANSRSGNGQGACKGQSGRKVSPSAAQIWQAVRPNAELNGGRRPSV